MSKRDDYPKACFPSSTGYVQSFTCEAIFSSTIGVVRADAPSFVESLFLFILFSERSGVQKGSPEKLTHHVDVSPLANAPSNYGSNAPNGPIVS